MNLRVYELYIPPTLLKLEDPATARPRSGSGSGRLWISEKGRSGMQTQTVEVVPPSTPIITLQSSDSEPIFTT